MDNIFNSAYLESTGQKSKVKNYADTYLYNVSNSEKEIFSFLMHAERIEKTNPIYDELKYDIKKQRVANFLLTVLESPNTILYYSNKSLPRTYKVICAKDPKDNGKLKVFIDVTGLISGEKDKLSYNNTSLQIIISYLVAGSFAMIYHSNPTLYFNKTHLIHSGAQCFSLLVYNIVDYLRIGAENNKSKIMYLSSKYFQLCIMNKPESDSVESAAKKISGISETEIAMLELVVKENPYINIKSFVSTIATVLKTDKLTLDVFIDKWMYHFGVGTQFATELLPAFIAMIEYAYIGAYLNNQKTIEKVIGRPMVEFVNELNRLGNEVIK